MKKMIFAVVCFLALPVLAQEQQGLTMKDMNALRDQAMKMQACIAGLPEGALQRMKTDSIAAEARLNALCKDGKRDEAMEYAKTHGEEMKDSEDYQAMRKCGEQAAAMMQDAPMQKMMKAEHVGHICDGYK